MKECKHNYEYYFERRECVICGNIELCPLGGVIPRYYENEDWTCLYLEKPDIDLGELFYEEFQTYPEESLPGSIRAV